MRIKITLSSAGSGCIDFNYQHQIQAVIYSFLASSDPDYASWLHEQGFVYKNDKRFKLFIFSGITFHGPIKINRFNSSNSLNGLSGLSGLNDLKSLSGLNGFFFGTSPTNPFSLSFQISSPVNQFIQHLIDGAFRKGSEIRLGSQSLNVYRVETLPDQLENIGSNSSTGLNGLSGLNLKPLESPIFVKKPMPSGQKDKYLFPGDEEYEDLLNQNLMHKYETLYGKSYVGEPLKFNFRLEQLERLNRFEPKLFKSFKVFKDGKIVGEIKGTLQPFTVSGPIELIRIGLDCGFGQNNSLGCGYVEVVCIPDFKNQGGNKYKQ